MKCVGIIWNCTMPYENEIMKIIEDNSKIINTFVLHLGDCYEEFVRQIYSTETIADWKVEEKIKHMKSSSSITDVRIIIYDITLSDKFYHPYKRCYVYSTLELLKMIIRSTCMNKIANYFFDIAFHSSESETEYANDLQIIKKFTNI